jgi:hypothetical protein
MFSSLPFNDGCISNTQPGDRFDIPDPYRAISGQSTTEPTTADRLSRLLLRGGRSERMFQKRPFYFYTVSPSPQSKHMRVFTEPINYGLRQPQPHLTHARRSRRGATRAEKVFGCGWSMSIKVDFDGHRHRRNDSKIGFDQN